MIRRQKGPGYANNRGRETSPPETVFIERDPAHNSKPAIYAGRGAYG